MTVPKKITKKSSFLLLVLLLRLNLRNCDIHTLFTISTGEKYVKRIFNKIFVCVSRQCRFHEASCTVWSKTRNSTKKSSIIINPNYTAKPEALHMYTLAHNVHCLCSCSGECVLCMLPDEFSRLGIYAPLPIVALDELFLWSKVLHQSTQLVSPAFLFPLFVCKFFPIQTFFPQRSLLNSCSLYCELYAFTVWRCLCIQFIWIFIMKSSPIWQKVLFSQ